MRAEGSNPTWDIMINLREKKKNQENFYFPCVTILLKLVKRFLILQELMGGCKFEGETFFLLILFPNHIWQLYVCVCASKYLHVSSFLAQGAGGMGLRPATLNACAILQL